MQQSETLRFKNDGPKRKKLWVGEAMSHPAKGHIAMWEEMVLRYSTEGDTILDPMAGIGTTLIAALMGRDVVCVELEPHFVDPMRRSWAKMRTMPMMGYTMGKATIIQGDARCLPLLSADAIITSPPYEGMEQHDSRSQDPEAIAKRAELFGKASGQNFNTPGRLRTIARAYGGYTRTTPCPCLSTDVTIPICDVCFDLVEMARGDAKVYHTSKCELCHGLSAIPTTRPVDAIVSSPPYEGSVDSGNSVRTWTEEAKRKWWANYRSQGGGMTFGAFIAYQESLAYRYTRPVDTIVSSPPFADSPLAQSCNGEANRRFRDGEFSGSLTKGMGLKVGYSSQGSNIGNLRSFAYWDAMKLVYAECWRVLKPGGILALVLKGFTRDGKYVDLPGQTEAMLLEAGWQKHDHWRRELWSLSFWRILQKRRDPAAFDERLNFEEVLAFRKPEGNGKGIDTVITSPPYANRLADTFTDDDPQRMSYSMGLKNLGNGVDTILTSPPYEGSVGDNKEGPNAGGAENRFGRWAKDTADKHGGYTRPGSHDG